MEKMMSEQEYIEATNPYRAKIKLQTHEIAMVNAMLSEIKIQLEYVRDHADEMTHEEIVEMIRDILQVAEKEEKHESSESNAK